MDQTGRQANGREGTHDPKRVFSTGEAAAICKVSQQTIIRCFDAGRIGGFRVPGSKFRRIPREELLRFMRANNIPADLLEAHSPVGRVLFVSEAGPVADAWASAMGEGVHWRIARDAFEAGREVERFRPHVLVLAGAVPGLTERTLRERVQGEVAPGAVLALEPGLGTQDACAAIRRALEDASGGPTRS
ncbi:MAG: helix-turn-helix domain-containing protein [Planctomycetota bacterium]|nr:helix-turn-helix domain-containing protein [Planctomycetota bacterium]